jgi:hypothetical protein
LSAKCNNQNFDTQLVWCQSTFAKNVRHALILVWQFWCSTNQALEPPKCCDGM